MSPSLPKTGAATPNASNGPVDVQLKVMVTDRRPAGTVHSTHHWYRSEPATLPMQPVAEENRPGHDDARPGPGGRSVTHRRIGSPDRRRHQPPSRCISASSSATVQRSSFSTVSVIVHG
jgi:hypothetical protein